MTGPMTKPLAALAALALGGCSLGSFVDQLQVPGDENPETYYREIVNYSGLAARYRRKDPNAVVQISDLRRSIAPQPGDWSTCLRATVQGKDEYLAIFIRNRNITESRSGVLIDRCEARTYALLPPERPGERAQAEPPPRPAEPPPMRPVEPPNWSLPGPGPYRTY